MVELHSTLIFSRLSKMCLILVRSVSTCSFADFVNEIFTLHNFTAISSNIMALNFLLRNEIYTVILRYPWLQS
jgi:hypothetical protein